MNQNIQGNFTVRVDASDKFEEIKFEDGIEAMRFFNRMKYKPIVRITLSKDGGCIRSYPESK